MDNRIKENKPLLNAVFIWVIETLEF